MNVHGWSQGSGRGRALGDRGVRAGDELADVDRNGLVLTACPPELLARVVEEVRPVLKRFGGMCLVSDAQWVVH